MKELISLATIGAIVALGRYLVSKDEITLRSLVGRGILGSALGLISYPITFLISSWLPIPSAAELHIMIGITAALAAMGTEILEKFLGAIVFKFTGKDPTGQ